MTSDTTKFAEQQFSLTDAGQQRVCRANRNTTVLCHQRLACSQEYKRQH